MARVGSILLMASLVSACAVTYPSRISDISSSDALNQLSADSAPQQAVVNGLRARDYLKLIAEQNTERSFLLYAVLAMLGVLLVLSLRSERAASVVPTPTEDGGPGEPHQP